MKAWVGWDPGQAGAMALMLEGYGAVAVIDWRDERYMFGILETWKVLYDIQAIAIEEQRVMPRDGSKSAKTFQQHTGACRCIIKLAGFEPIDVTPQAWMKRRVKAKKNHLDKPSVEYVEAKYPLVSIRGPLGGIKDGRTDAICIAEWCKENHSGSEF